MIQSLSSQTTNVKGCYHCQTGQETVRSDYLAAVTTRLAFVGPVCSPVHCYKSLPNEEKSEDIKATLKEHVI